MSLVIIEITKYSELPDYKSQWTDLLQLSDADPLFMSFEWIENWLKYFGHNYEMRFYFVHYDNSLIGIFPLIIRKKELLNQLTIAGVGDADYIGFIINNKYLNILKDVFSENIFPKVNNWSYFSTTKSFKNDLTSLIIINLLNKTNYKSYHRRFSTAPYLEINNDYDSYIKSISNKIVKDSIRQEKRLYNKYGPVELKTVNIDNDFDYYLNILSGFHKDKCKRKKTYSSFNDASYFSFFINMAKYKELKPLLHFTYLEADGNILSMHFGYLKNNKLYYLLPVYNQQFQNYSPGRILVLKLIKLCYDNNISYFDFCYGDELYKYDFTKMTRDLYEITYYNNNLSGAISFIYKEYLRKYLRNNNLIMNYLYPKLRKYGFVKYTS